MTLVFNVINTIEGVILQEIVLWSLCDPPFLRTLCFARGRKRHFKGSYGLRMKENCPTVVFIGCATT